MKRALLFCLLLAYLEARVFPSDPEDIKDMIKAISENFARRNAQKNITAPRQQNHLQKELGAHSCSLCDYLIESILIMRKWSASDEAISKLVTEVCADFHIEDRKVCDGLLGPTMDVLLYVMDNAKNVTAGKFCSLLLGTTCHNQFDYFNWTIEIPEKKMKILDKVVNESGNLRILQLSDFHYDPRYTPGAKAVCDQVLCCQDDQGVPDKPEEACGIWGDFRKADTPRKTLDEALRHVKTQKVDYVYFTGDIISHRVWSTSMENNSKVEHEIMELMRNNFDVPVLFVLGNHEPHPVDLYTPLEVDDKDLAITWLFDILRDELKDYATEEELETIKRGGFYTLVLRPGLRIIVLNNNVCYLENFWLMYEDYDPYGQLTWLVTVLEEAEKNGEYVHLLYHVPTGSSGCLGTWSREFTRIINRFAETISAQFNGHTHVDEFFLYFDETDPSIVVNGAFNGASLATFTKNAPSYKVYEIDSTTYRVADAEEWTFNLTAANLKPENPTVDWYKLYSFKETYGLSTMEWSDIGQMVLNMAKNKTTLELYNRFKYRMGSGAERECNDDCHKSNLCEIVTSHLADTQHCEMIKKIYDDNNKY